MSSAWTIFYRVTDQRRALADQLAFRIDPTRCYVSAVYRGRRNLQSCLSGFTHPLPVRSCSDDENKRARAINMLGLAKRVKASIPSSFHLGGLRRSRHSSANCASALTAQATRVGVLIGVCCATAVCCAGAFSRFIGNPSEAVVVVRHWIHDLRFAGFLLRPAFSCARQLRYRP
jgi:hypothetical protein